MYKIEISVVGNIAKVVSRPKRITAGTVGLPVHFTFDEHWNGLRKTAVFHAGVITRIVEDLATETAVPSDVLRKAEEYFSIGVYGINADGSIAIPTIWADIGLIDLGVDIDGGAENGAPMPIWMQILDKAEYAEDVAESAEKEVKDLKDYLNQINVQPINIPLAQFDLTRNMIDVSGDMKLPNGEAWSFARKVSTDNKHGLFSTMDQVYALYDDLVANHEEWEVLDAATKAKLPYPKRILKGIPVGKNLFNRNRVPKEFQQQEIKDAAGNVIDVKEMTGTQINTGRPKSGHIDLLTGKGGSNHSVEKENLAKMILLKPGTYTFSYKIDEVADYAGSDGNPRCTIRAFGAVTRDASGYIDSDSYAVSQLTSSLKEEDGIQYDTFTIKEIDYPDGQYVSLRRTTMYAAIISNVQIEFIPNGESTNPTEYEPYGHPAYRYKLDENEACVDIKTMDDPEAQGEGWQTYYQMPTPAYTLNLYHFSFVNDSLLAAPGKTNEKRKILLVSGIHGDEKAAPFNSYLFCKRLSQLCDGDDYFRFAQAFDVYVLPCVNGYGQFQNTQWNANGININRNFDSDWWHSPVSGLTDVTKRPGTMLFPGVSPDSEFEVQLLQKLVQELKPDMVCDLHNYTEADRFQFYSELAWKKWAPLLYQSAVDCSLAFKKEYPQYFGKNIQLLRQSDAGQIECESKRGNLGTWLRTKGNVYFPALIEISQAINYIAEEITDADGNHVGWGDAVYNSSGSDKFGKTTFSVGEFTLRIQMMRYGEFVLKNKPKG